MRRRTLPGTTLEVSEVCLGTMTWGEQNSEADAHAQLDLAVSRGVNFIDTAEMYPVPPNATTQGRTESYLGSWIAKRGRDGLVIASKIAGPGRRDWIRNGRTDITRSQTDPSCAWYLASGKGTSQRRYSRSSFDRPSTGRIRAGDRSSLTCPSTVSVRTIRAPFGESTSSTRMTFAPFSAIVWSSSVTDPVAKLPLMSNFNPP